MLLLLLEEEDEETGEVEVGPADTSTGDGADTTGAQTALMAKELPK